MFVNSRKAVASAKSAVRNLYIRNANENGKKLNDTKIMAKHLLHTTAQRPNYASLANFPIPTNINASESKNFSPQRSRDITDNVIVSQHAPVADWSPSENITSDATEISRAELNGSYDPHVQSYDCQGAVSLNSVMQTNVPQPYLGMKKFSHLNMPGGQYSQESKFTAEDMQKSHYQELSHQVQSAWESYVEDGLTNQKACSLGAMHSFSYARQATNMMTTGMTLLRPQSLGAKGDRMFCSKAEPKDVPKVELSKKEQLKRAFKEYGATIVVFHVAISLVSLGGFYALVSGGIDMMPILNYLGLTSTALSNKIATGASTFVVAYAVHKVFAPVRISITLGATPFIVRYLRSKGFLKPKIVKQK